MRRPSVREIDIKGFEILAARALEGIPRPFARHLEGVLVRVEEEASPEIRSSLGLSRGEDLLGLYSGLPITGRSFFSVEGGLPPEIVLYRKPILAGCLTIRQVIRRIRETVVHEVGHHLGLSDEEMPY
jgi:predicted Zn-dependent protease with MMP-like domain